MAPFRSSCRCAERRRRGPMGPLVLLSLCLAVVVVLPGCSGCRKTPQQRAAEKAKKEAERRCKNCGRWVIDGDGYGGVCKQLQCYTPDDFGCVRFIYRS